MGMDLKGITVKPNGKYLARVRVGSGERLSKVFDTPVEAKKWINRVKLEGIRDNSRFSPMMKVSAWFNYIIENLLTDIRINTKLSYISKYNTWIGPVIGNMAICEVRPYNCMDVLNDMRAAGRKDTSIDQVRIVMHIIFEYALENQLITSNPVTRSVKLTGKIVSFNESKFLTRHEQIIFIEEARYHDHFDVFSFILQTGLRYGELTGLEWSDIDFGSRIMHIQRSASYLQDCGEFVVGPPKSAHGYRDIYLTDEAIRILQNMPHKSNYIFVGGDNLPIKRAVYNMMLRRICAKCGIKEISLHSLRHTFATRCIEAGMKPKTLQKILGHSDVTITLNYYVHVSDNELANEMNKLGNYMGTKFA